MQRLWTRPLDRWDGPFDTHIKPETFIAVGDSPAFPHELPLECGDRRRLAEILRVLAQDDVAVFIEGEMHAAEIRECGYLRIAQADRGNARVVSGQVVGDLLRHVAIRP